ncbi:MAG: hypothetical protein ACRDWX_12305 [Acidimicrobiia bacterium]
MQQWRRVASHFNRVTAFDETVFALMGVSIIFVALVIVAVTGWSFLSLEAPLSLAWAIRIGLLFLLLSQTVGGAMIDNDSNTFGAAGAAKVPHALTLHAVQVLPALAWVLGFADLDERTRLRVVGVGALGYGSISAVAMLQAFGGRATFDLLPSLTTLLVAGVGLLLSATVSAVLAVYRRPVAA